MYGAFELQATFGPACLIGLLLVCLGAAIVYFSAEGHHGSVGFGAGIAVAGFIIIVIAPWVGYGPEKERVWQATVAQCQTTPGCSVYELENRLHRNQFPVYRKQK